MRTEQEIKAYLYDLYKQKKTYEEWRPLPQILLWASVGTDASIQCLEWVLGQQPAGGEG